MVDGHEIEIEIDIHLPAIIMSSSKAALKAIADAVKQQRFDDALEQAQNFIQKEPKNHQA